MAGYSGAWRTARERVDVAAPLGRPEYSALHADPGTRQAGSRPPGGARRSDYAPPDVEDPGTAYDPVTMRQAPGLRLDHESSSDHSGGLTGGGYKDSQPAAGQRAANRARSKDLGAAWRQVFRAPSLVWRSERRETTRREITPTGHGSKVQPFRGANSLPENNPDGFRYGYRVQRWMDRPIWLRRRTHDLRGIRLPTAAAATRSPALDADNRYMSPFDNQARGKIRIMQAPVTRRNPRDWSEAAASDGTGEYVEPIQTWGL